MPSEVYPEPGAMSYRSSAACGGSWDRPSIATARGDVVLDTLGTEVAPRGLRTSWVAMRGRPTVPGETDTAQVFSPWTTRTATSAASASETVTTTPPQDHPYEAPYFAGYVYGVGWTITTHGADSYDVAAVTAHYTYLTPAG